MEVSLKSGEGHTLYLPRLSGYVSVTLFDGNDSARVLSHLPCDLFVGRCHSGKLLGGQLPQRRVSVLNAFDEPLVNKMSLVGHPGSQIVFDGFVHPRTQALSRSPLRQEASFVIGRKFQRTLQIVVEMGCGNERWRAYHCGSLDERGCRIGLDFPNGKQSIAECG